MGRIRCCPLCSDFKVEKKYRQGVLRRGKDQTTGLRVPDAYIDRIGGRMFAR